MARTTMTVPLAQEETTMPRGKRPKRGKAPTKLERLERLRERILTLGQDLLAEGFGAQVPPPGPIRLTAEAIHDPKTGGWIGHVEEPLGTYIQRVSIVGNFSQRPPFDHITDPIYRRLIRDFLTGAVMPEAKVAVLSGTGSETKVAALDAPDIRYSMIDGLQRLYCYCLALLLVLRREHLVQEGVIPADAWTYFAESVQSTGEPQQGTEALLQRVIRYEVFSEIDLSGLLHYMVTFNTGQRRMSLAVQLEIMRQPLIEALEKQAQIPVWHAMHTLPSLTRPKEQFDAKDLVLAAEAFLTHNAHVSAAEETERFLDEDHPYLEDIGEIHEVVTVLQYLATQMQPRLLQVYAHDPTRRFLLSGGGTFLISLAAACGYVRWRNNMKMLEGALDKLLVLLHRPVEDPLNLDAYQRTLTRITSARGRNIRRLVNDTFLRFFSGVTSELEWEDTAGQILGD